MNKYTPFLFGMHIFICFVIYLIFLDLNIFKVSPNNINYLNWDANFYHSIMSEGYEYIPYTGCNLAFFPLFPLIWKITGFSPAAISAFNLIVFFCSSLCLFYKQSFSNSMFLFVISLPPFIFLALPYSEAFFFAGVTILICGYRQENRLLKNFGFFIASFVKPVSVIFIPAIIICELLYYKPHHSKTAFKKEMLHGSLSSFFGLLIAALIQGIQTGKWFYFFEMQQYWGRHWIIPKVPFYAPIAFDSVAFVVGVLAICFCIKLFFIKVNSYSNLNSEAPDGKDKAVLLSALYLSATTVLDCFFTYNLGGANLWSINRHLLSTPFAIVFIVWLVRDLKASKIEYLGILSIVFLGIYISGAYINVQQFMTYALFFLGLSLFRFNNNSPKYLLILYLINCILQMNYYHAFLSGRWIG